MSQVERFKVSVVIITCDRPDYLKTALQSVFEQTVKPYEVIVVDDCSSVDYEHVKNYFSNEKINYHRLSQRSGANMARNCGVEMSSGDIIAFLDDDDIWLENFILTHQEYYQQDNQIGALMCGYKVMGNERKHVINKRKVINADELRLGNHFSGMSGFSARRHILMDHLFDPCLKNGQDWDLFVRLIQADIKFVNITQALFLYRLQTPDGITTKAKRMAISDVEQRLQSAFKHEKWLGEKYYKKRVAEQVLSFLPNKSNKLGWIKKSIELAGLKATLRELLHKMAKKLAP